MDEQVTIPKKRYDKMMERLRLLSAMEQAGVDNWEGMSEAYAILDPEDDDEE